MEDKNPFDEYSSDIHHIIIPLENFKSFHQTRYEFDDEKSFIGRTTIIGKLKNWISNKKTETGAYLITGYRGMGKSSFVDKVIQELTHKETIIKEKTFQIFKFTLLILGLILYIFFDLNHISLPFGITGNLALFLIAIFLMVLGGIPIKYCDRIKNKKKTEIKENEVNNGDKSIDYIPIQLNIGNELISHNDEILRLIIKSLHTKFTEYIKNPAAHLLPSYILIIFQLLATIFIAENGYDAITYFAEKDNVNIEKNVEVGKDKTASTKETANNYVIVNNKVIVNGKEKVADTKNNASNTATNTKASLISKYIIEEYAYMYQIINYLLVFYLVSLLCTQISLFVSRYKLFGIKTLEGINEEFEDLYLRCIASIDENYSHIKKFNSYIPFFNRNKKFEKATLREMEQLLIEIFEHVHSLSHLPYDINIRFVIVLDELDKIDTYSEQASTSDKNIPVYETSVNGFTGTVNARKRKQELMHTLGNMKYFLSTAKAKFIFIAGRELYDAYLGDVSDREFSISSVFDGVININSFFKSDSQSMDITAMTEKYICHRLMPKYLECERNLAEYHKYACTTLFKDKLERNIRNTTFLYQYIMYLVHMSNGSPKKLAVYFEKDIRTYEHLVHIKKIELEDHHDYYLYFNVKDIEKIGFMHYLSYPIMQTMISKSKIYEDKLLLSTSFMINHIFKYHNIGFSWRNLEYSPELLDMNKMPELRDFLGTIISILSQEYLSRIHSGLYLFKFPMSISEEISFLSRRREDISALFHFSKDESLPIKRHYVHLLDYYTQNNNKIDNEELNNLASIHNVLGDLYQADEDYSLAINEYQIGLQLIEKQIRVEGNKDMSMSNMLFFVRNMLKLGISYEKRKTFDTAYTIYNELFLKIINYGQYIINNNTPNDSDVSTKFSVTVHQSFFANLRIAYLPIIAKLFVLEKVNKEGITSKDIDNAYNEINTIISIYKKSDNQSAKNCIDYVKGDAPNDFFQDNQKSSRLNIILADFYLKIGTILYYKNDKSTLKDKDLQYLKKSLYLSFNQVSEQKYSEKNFSIEKVMNWLQNAENLKGIAEEKLITLADTLKGYGNINLGNCKDEVFTDNILKDTFYNLSGFYKLPLSQKYTSKTVKATNCLEKALLSYIGAGILYDKGGSKRNSVLMFIQVLETLTIHYRVLFYDENNKDKINQYKHNISDNKDLIGNMVNHIISILYEHNDSINALEISKLKVILGMDIGEDMELRRLPLSPDIEELIYKYYGLIIRCEDESKSIKKLYTSSLVGHYRQISTLSQDIYNLRFKFFLNEHILEKICKISRTKKSTRKDILDQIYAYFSGGNNIRRTLLDLYGIDIEENTFENKMDILNYLIVDNLSCLSKISNMLQPLKNPKIFLSYFLGDINLYLAFWKSTYDILYTTFKNADRCANGERIENLESYKNEATNKSYLTLSKYLSTKVDVGNSLSKRLKSYLQMKVTGVSYERLSWNYNAEMILINYNRATEMHSQGLSYKEMITSLYFLDEDLNNDSLQQKLAIERYLINSGNLEKRKIEMESKLNKSRVFDIKKYI